MNDRRRARAIAESIVSSWLFGDETHSSEIEGEDAWRVDHKDLIARIEAALTPPSGHVRLPPELDGREARFCTHMGLPDSVVWSKNGWYIQLADGSWRWVCGLLELGLEKAAREVAEAARSRDGKRDVPMKENTND